MGTKAGRRINVFKIDCEGCEWPSFDFINSEKGGLRDIKIDQVLVEVHVVSKKGLRLTHAQAQSFFSSMDRRGMMVYHKERNHWGCDGYRCMEYAFISTEWAAEVYRLNHCPWASSSANINAGAITSRC